MIFVPVQEITSHREEVNWIQVPPLLGELAFVHTGSRNADEMLVHECDEFLYIRTVFKQLKQCLGLTDH